MNLKEKIKWQQEQKELHDLKKTLFYCLEFMHHFTAEESKITEKDISLHSFRVYVSNSIDELSWYIKD